jgi:hypothetical protein
MAVDPSVLSQLDTAHARGVAASAAFFEQHAAMITSASQFDSRLENGFLAAQLFSESLVQSKAAYHTPVEPSAAPLPSAPAK